MSTTESHSRNDVVQVQMKPSRWTNKLFLQRVAVTILFIVMMIGLPMAISNVYGEDMSWTRLEGHYSGESIQEMAFLGTWEERIAVCNLNGLHIYYRENQSTAGPIRLNSSSHYGGGFDLVCFYDTAFIATYGTNGGIATYEKDWRDEQYKSWNYTLHNVTEDTQFSHIERRFDSPFNILYLGSTTHGVGICNMSTRQVAFLNTSDGLPSNHITALRLRGKTLLIGTTQGFALYDTETKEILVRTTDETENVISVQTIEYYAQNHRIYVGSDDGLVVFYENGQEIQPISPQSRFTGPDGLETDSIHASCLDKRTKRLYLGTSALCYIDLTKEETEINQMVSRSDLERIHAYPSVNTIIVPEDFGKDYLYFGTGDGYVVRVPLGYSQESTSSVLTVNSMIVMLCAVAIIGIWAWHYRENITERVRSQTAKDPSEAAGDPLFNASRVVDSGSKSEAIELIRRMIDSAEVYIKIRDNYISKEVIDYLSKIREKVDIQLLTVIERVKEKKEKAHEEHLQLMDSIENLVEKNPDFEVRLTHQARTHARNVVTESHAWTIDISLKDLGGLKQGTITHLSSDDCKKIEVRFDKLWGRSKAYERPS